MLRNFAFIKGEQDVKELTIKCNLSDLQRFLNFIFDTSDSILLSNRGADVPKDATQAGCNTSVSDVAAELNNLPQTTAISITQLNILVSS